MKIILGDEFDLNEEEHCMLQSLYSRDHTSMVSHVEDHKHDNTTSFLKKYYIGYNHKSIGEGGNIRFYIENVPSIVATVFQDYKYYRGQESSTRYIDFSSNGFYDAIDNNLSNQVMTTWYEFYLTKFEELFNYNLTIFEKPESSKEEIWKKSVKARTFDIMRGFLPVGYLTSFSWVIDLASCYDNLIDISFHPLEPVRECAKECLRIAKEKYPTTFCKTEYDEKLKFLDKYSKECNYLSFPNSIENKEIKINLYKDFSYVHNISMKTLSDYGNMISERPRGIYLRMLDSLGDINYTFSLDFGCYRDLHRHRNDKIFMNILNTDFGFHEWYINQFPEAMRTGIRKLVEFQFEKINTIEQDVGYEKSQYLYPLGTILPVELRCSLPQSVYISELRSQKTVHPILRSIAQKIGKAVIDISPKYNIYVDFDENDFSIKRGNQDITKIS